MIGTAVAIAAAIHGGRETNMEITREQFIENYEKLDEEAQESVVDIFENNSPEDIRNLFATVGVEFPTSIDEPMRREDSIDYIPPEPFTIEAADPELYDASGKFIGNEVDQPMENKRWDPDTGEEVTTPNNSPEDGRDTLLQEAQREGMALGDQPTSAAEVVGMINKDGASNSGIADDIPVDAENNSFIVNAAAMELFGYERFVNEILRPNIESLKERTGKEIRIEDITEPQEQIEGEAPIAISNREVYIPKELAEEIGYSVLEKINAAGKAETEERIAEQEPQAEMQAALGKRVEMSNGDKVIPVPKRKPSRSRKQEDIAMAETLIAEAGMFDRQGMQKVMNVIQNRQKSKLNFKEDSKDFFSITSAPGQFSGYIGRAQDKFKPTKKQMNDALDLVRLARENKLEDLTGGAIYFYNPAGAAGKKFAETKAGMEFMEKVKNNPNFVMTTSDGKEDSDYRLEYFAPRKDVSENIALDSDTTQNILPDSNSTQSVPLDKVEVGRDENITRDLLPSFGATASGEVVGP